jgi:aspartate kinase
MKIIKFGGTSIGSALRFKKIVPLIYNNEPKIIVLSAMSGTTNDLVEFTKFIRQQTIP